MVVYGRSCKSLFCDVPDEREADETEEGESEEDETLEGNSAGDIDADDIVSDCFNEGLGEDVADVRYQPAIRSGATPSICNIAYKRLKRVRRQKPSRSQRLGSTLITLSKVANFPCAFKRRINWASSNKGLS